MAPAVRGSVDAIIQSLKDALGAYEAERPGADAALYRQNAGSVRVRVIDRRFEGAPKARRHDDVWNLLASRVPEDTVAEVSQVLAIAPAEMRMSFSNLDVEQPIPSPVVSPL